MFEIIEELEKLIEKQIFLKVGKHHHPRTKEWKEFLWFNKFLCDLARYAHQLDGGGANYEVYELRAERMNEYIQKEHPCSGIRLHWM